MAKLNIQVSPLGYANLFLDNCLVKPSDLVGIKLDEVVVDDAGTMILVDEDLSAFVNAFLEE